MTSVEEFLNEIMPKIRDATKHFWEISWNKDKHFI